jgi:hypothetical protein
MSCFPIGSDQLESNRRAQVNSVFYLDHGKIAMRLLDIFEKVEFGQDFFVQMQPIIEEECNNDVYYHLLRIIYQELRKVQPLPIPSTTSSALRSSCTST